MKPRTEEVEVEFEFPVWRQVRQVSLWVVAQVRSTVESFGADRDGNRSVELESSDVYEVKASDRGGRDVTRKLTEEEIEKIVDEAMRLAEIELENR